MLLGIVGVLLGGCAGDPHTAREKACRVFSPAQIETPSSQGSGSIDGQSGANGGMPSQRCD
jgi:hypothetical protein